MGHPSSPPATSKITKLQSQTPKVKWKKYSKTQYHADATAWFEYVPTKVGNYTLKFDFPGGYFPAGNYTTAAGAFGGVGTVSFTDSAYYKPSSSPVRTLVVQSMVASWPLSALPTDYWTRPVHVENREWWTISGNWPGTGYQGGGSIWDQLYPDTSPTWNAQHKFTPWVQGPNSGHILWKEQGNLAGIIGGQAGNMVTQVLPQHHP